MTTTESLGPTIRPRVLKRVKASYTPAARAARADGKVVVNVIIDERGEISWTKAVSGHELLRLPALRAARQCLFTPALRDGLPVKVRGTLEFTFSLY